MKVLLVLVLSIFLLISLAPLLVCSKPSAKVCESDGHGGVWCIIDELEIDTDISDDGGDTLSPIEDMPPYPPGCVPHGNCDPPKECECVLDCKNGCCVTWDDEDEVTPTWLSFDAIFSSLVIISWAILMPIACYYSTLPTHND